MDLNLRRLLPVFVSFLLLILVAMGIWSYVSLKTDVGKDGSGIDVEFLWDMTKEFTARYWYLYLILFVSVLIYAPLSTIGIANASTYFSSFMERDMRVTPETAKSGEHLKGWYVFLLVLLVSMVLFTSRNYLREIMFPRALALITTKMYDRYLHNYETSSESAVDENLGDVLYSMRSVSDNASWIIVYWWTDVLTVGVMMIVLTVYLCRIRWSMGMAAMLFSLAIIASGVVYNIHLVKKVNAYFDSEREVMRKGEQYITNAGLISAFGLRETMDMAGFSDKLNAIRNDFTSAEHSFYGMWRIVIMLFFAYIFYKALHDRSITATAMTQLIFVLVLFLTFLSDMSTEMIDKAWRFASVANSSSARFFARSAALKEDEAKMDKVDWAKRAGRGGGAMTLRVDHVGFKYEHAEAPVLEDVSLVAQPGDVVVIKGKSGSGKSTFLKILASLELPTSGKVTLAGVDMSEVRKSSWRQQVLYVSQKWGLFQGSILDNILMGTGITHIPAESMQAFVNLYGLNSVIPYVGAKVGNSASTGGGHMSGGMAKMIVILRAALRVMPEPMFRKHFGSKPRRTMSRPTVVLFDEPLAALDKGSRHNVKRLLVDTVKADTSIVSFFIMHSDDMDDAASTVLDWSKAEEEKR
jgi:ABC-type multidrug transport system fused ATPase/permease subunit